jgi:hypothetical protein
MVKKLAKKMKKSAVKKPAKKPVAKKQAHKPKPQHKPKPVHKPAVHHKTEAEEQEPKDWGKDIQTLIHRSIARGFITESEILHALPDLEENVPALEELLDTLDSRGVEVVEAEMASV